MRSLTRHIYTLSRLMVLALLALVLAACGTTGTNQMAMSAYQDALQSKRLAVEQHASSCATAAAGCAEDMCRVAVMLACGHSRPSADVPQPRLRSPGEEFARGISPITGLLNTGLQVWGAGWLVDRSGQNMVDLVGSVGSVVGQVQGPVDNSINVGGNYGDTRGDEIGGDAIGGDRIDDRSVGRDQIGRDQRVGDDVDGSCIGDNCRNVSDGPIDQSNPGDDNNDNSTGPDPDPDP